MSTSLKTIKKKDAIITYKGFNKDDKGIYCAPSKRHYFEVGKVYQHKGEVKACNSGYHSCEKPTNVNKFYSINDSHVFAKCKVWGKIDDSEDDKTASEYIQVIEMIDWQEFRDMTNTGQGNSGDRNSGDLNSGDLNSGGYNEGKRNSGFCNNANYCSGVFNSEHGKSGYFNKDFDGLAVEHFMESYAYNLMSNLKITQWGDFEKRPQNGAYGKVQAIEYKTAWKNLWDGFDDDDKQHFFDLPNFDKKVFEEVTGIKIK